MLKRWIAIASVSLCVWNTPCFSEGKEIAITIDDLPFVASGSNTPKSLQRTHERFMAIVNTLVENQVPATGFAIGEAVAKNEWYLLEAFRNQGLSIGNHTYTHQSLQALSSDKYIADIERAEAKLSRVMTYPKYFRYPYLAEGNGQKRQKVVKYLLAHGYIIAPVTIDSKDYAFNAKLYHVPRHKRVQLIEQSKKRYLAYIWKQTLLAEQSGPVKQILLLHANLLNSYCLGDIIQLYKSHGYTFITLDEALNGNDTVAAAKKP